MQYFWETNEYARVVQVGTRVYPIQYSIVLKELYGLYTQALQPSSVANVVYGV